VCRTFRLNVPKTYSYEYVTVGCNVARALGSKGLLQKRHDNRTDLTVVGYDSDIDYVWQLTESLVRQCTIALGVWYSANVRPWHTGTDKFQMKRGFISGFAKGAEEKLSMIKKQTIDEAPTGTDIAVRSRESQVIDWMNSNMRTGMAAGRRYEASSRVGGWSAGQQADVGGARVGGIRKEIGG
jgi:hypothetical protein